jgi:hypothetical protein
MSYRSGAWPSLHSAFIAFSVISGSMRIMRRVREARLEWKGRDRALLRLHSRGKDRNLKKLEKEPADAAGSCQQGNHRREPSPELIRSDISFIKATDSFVIKPSTVEVLSIYTSGIDRYLGRIRGSSAPSTVAGTGCQWARRWKVSSAPFGIFRLRPACRLAFSRSIEKQRINFGDPTP